MLKDIDAATTIIFTDKGWDDTTGFSNLSGDSQFTWVSESARAAGSIVTIYMSDLGLGGGAYSVIGDQLFAIQGSIATPILLQVYNITVHQEMMPIGWDCRLKF